MIRAVDPYTKEIQPSRPGRWKDVVEALAIYYAGSLVVGCGVLFAHDMMIDVAHDYENSKKPKQDWTLLNRLTVMDGGFYERIAREGYDYHAPTHGPARSNLVFFPMYPLLTRGVMSITGASGQLALLVVSNIGGVASAGLLAIYTHSRYPDAPRRFHHGVSLALAFVPAGFFFRVGYSESVCLFLLLVFCLGIARGWHPAIVAIIAGTASAARPVAIAAAVPALIYAWRRRGRMLPACEAGPEFPRANMLAACCYGAETGLLLVLSCWGLLAFIGYQWSAFGDPFVFVHAQESIHFREADGPWDKTLSLATLEPIWSAYIPGSEGNWRNVPFRGVPPFDMQWMNPIYFVMAALSLAYAARRRLLDMPVFVLGVTLLAIPYVTRAYELCMGSHARFALMVIPMYVAFGDVFCRLPAWLATLLVVAAAILLFGHTAMFAAGYMII